MFSPFSSYSWDVRAASAGTKIRTGFEDDDKENAPFPRSEPQSVAQTSLFVVRACALCIYGLHIPHHPRCLGSGSAGLPYVALSENHLVVQEGGAIVRELLLTVEAVLTGAGQRKRGAPLVQRLRRLKHHAEEARLCINGVWLSPVQPSRQVSSESPREVRQRRGLLANSVEDDELWLGHLSADEDAGASAQIHKAVWRLLLVLRVEKPMALKREEARLPATAPTASPQGPSLQITVRGNSPFASSIVLRVHHDLELPVAVREYRMAASVLEAPIGHLLEASEGPHGRRGRRRQRWRGAVFAIVHLIIAIGLRASLSGVSMSSVRRFSRATQGLKREREREEEGLEIQRRTSQLGELCRLVQSKPCVDTFSAAARAFHSS
eukprot:scaffold1337_cov165-Pinguiococcus_pyrenoidosus.AAC.5